MRKLSLFILGALLFGLFINGVSPSAMSENVSAVPEPASIVINPNCPKAGKEFTVRIDGYKGEVTYRISNAAGAVLITHTAGDPGVARFIIYQSGICTIAAYPPGFTKPIDARPLVVL